MVLALTPPVAHGMIISSTRGEPPPTPTKGLMIMTAAKTMTTATLADALDTDPRTLRKFLRSAASPVASVGKGKRYTLPGTKAALTDFGKRFAAWNAAQADAKKQRDAIVLADDDETADALAENEALDADDATDDDAEPTDDELEDITAELDA
jgi:hypothetical protein